ILWALGNEGIIDATRGSGGGYRLKRRPEEIHLIDVVELFEKSKGKPACLLGDNRECTDVDPCSAHESWRDVRSVYIRFLESTTIAAIAGKTCAPAKKKGLTQISTR
ncbi:MAG: Rrf2 family transcriptional regulator, partial [Acidobacteriia bacterium]|nr:Rrf2 family transcriptional regulator [Terriglobia bacterium]